MIIAKTPLRIPLAGGLTDLKPYALRFGGVTVSSSIDKYVYVFLKENLGGYFRLRYQDVQEKVFQAGHIKHDLIREAIKFTDLEDEPLDIVIMADLAGESGLGTSGAVTVSLLHALHAYRGKTPSKQQLLQEAAHIEVDILGGASGYHDPSICALGGLKRLDYQPDTENPSSAPLISAKDIALSPTTREAFAGSLLFFYGGQHHQSKPSLALLSSHLDDALDTLHAIKELGYELEHAFETGDLMGIARCIGEMQRLKQQLPGNFEDDYVTSIVQRVREVGAYAQLPGGKISAFVIVCCPHAQQDKVRKALSDLKEIKIGLETGGAQVMRV